MIGVYGQGPDRGVIRPWFAPVPALLSPVLVWLFLFGDVWRL